VRALLSVANRDGIGPFARDLLELGVEVFATDGTREVLASDGIEVGPISALTAVPPLLGGQVKTFHPAVYAGILARRDRPDQLAELAEQGIGQIDVVVVNVKPFAPQVGARVVPLDEAIEMIDVGGVALLSAAARNYAGVAAVPDPAYYPQVLAELRTRGQVSAELRQRLDLRWIPDLAFVADTSIERGARVRAGGAPLDRPGWFYAPTVLTGVPRDAPAATEEVFGPVAPIFRVPDTADAIALANATPLGLGASVWTREPGEAARAVEEIDAGMVFVNAMVASDPRFPFGGVKASGYGREVGLEGLREFVNVKTVRGTA